jgi:hypothetical protein
MPHVPPHTARVTRLHPPRSVGQIAGLRSAEPGSRSGTRNSGSPGAFCTDSALQFVWRAGANLAITVDSRSCLSRFGGGRGTESGLASLAPT